MLNIFPLRPKVGDAIWLWTILNFGTSPKDADREWFPVAEGVGLTDRQLAGALGCTKETLTEWRERLESVGMIRTTLVPGKDVEGDQWRKFEVVSVHYGEKKPESPFGSGTVN